MCLTNSLLTDLSRFEIFTIKKNTLPRWFASCLLSHTLHFFFLFFLFNHWKWIDSVLVPWHLAALSVACGPAAFMTCGLVGNADP